MNDFYRILQILKQHQQQRFAMATIIEVIGSSYRKLGAKMLFSEDGNSYGTVSAGCLEEDLAHHARTVILSQNPHTVTYDLMTDDVLSWGANIGCNGKITIWVEPIDWSKVATIEEQFVEGRSVISVKCIRGEERGILRIYMEENLGYIEFGQNTSTQITQDFQQLTFSKDQLVHIESLNGFYFIEKYQPRERIIIFGAGPDVEPIVSLAARLDFAVTVIDPRENRCNAKNFPDADQLILVHPETYLQNNILPIDSYILVMTHNFDWDRQIVEQLIEQPCHYVGVLGPRRRMEAFLPNQPIPDWIHSPVGLSIDAEGPEEISVSILAQIIQKRRMVSRPITNQLAQA